jgi:hypothetical protein
MYFSHHLCLSWFAMGEKQKAVSFSEITSQSGLLCHQLSTLRGAASHEAQHFVTAELLSQDITLETLRVSRPTFAK